MTRYGTDISERALYRKALHKAAERGGSALRRFLNQHTYLFAEQELSRARRTGLSYGWDKIAHCVDHKFRSYRGSPFDPLSSEFPIIDTIVTPHAFIRHQLMLTGD